jgi:hypothetical protein
VLRRVCGAASARRISSGHKNRQRKQNRHYGGHRRKNKSA